MFQNHNLKLFAIFCILLTAGLALRLANINKMPIHDDNITLWCLEQCFASSPHPPTEMSFTLDAPPFLFVGYFLAKMMNINVFLVSLFYFSLTAVFTYLLGKELYSKEKGLIAVSFLSLSYYSVLVSQNITDGPINTFLLSAMLYFYVLYSHRNKMYGLVLSIAFMTLLMLVRLNNIVYLLPLFVYELYRVHNLGALKKAAPMLLALLLFPFLWYALIQILGVQGNTVGSTFFHYYIFSVEDLARTPGIKAEQIMQLLFRITPPAMILLLATLYTTVVRKRQLPFAAAALLAPLLTFIIVPRGEMLRYLFPALPLAAILIASEFKARDLLKCARPMLTLAVPFFALFYIFDINEYQTLPSIMMVKPLILLALCAIEFKWLSGKYDRAIVFAAFFAVSILFSFAMLSQERSADLANSAAAQDILDYMDAAGISNATVFADMQLDYQMEKKGYTVSYLPLEDAFNMSSTTGYVAYSARLPREMLENQGLYARFYNRIKIYSELENKCTLIYYNEKHDTIMSVLYSCQVR